ncbi:hypothetical protein ASD50_18330 [Mesorhizobium sp. Root552]|uniref:hypothetical protein n=1 Tax=Mesorhizobium sp. Root552 TaxID=1736555 RepID=UPI0006FCF976|nr:hypothetical protein [Mesorhizobium sp. Root552]KQZ29149.1 hypothetical protein ASD50_18330 [Mesorhizobium sp. Root552]
MANKQDKKGRSRGGPAFVQLFHWVRQTDAWRSLSPWTRLLYIEIRARYAGSNNGDIPMSYREAAEILGCSNGPVIAAFRELQDRGFIVLVHKGSFNWKVRFHGVGRATTWRLTELPADYPERSLTPSYEFKAWKPASKNKTRRENLTPKASESHAINSGMASESHANGVKISRHFGGDGLGDGVKISCTSISTISPQPLGDISRALLNSRIVKSGAR